VVIPRSSSHVAKPSLRQKVSAELIGTFFVTLVPTVVDIGYYTGEHVDYVSRWLARGFITIALIYALSAVSGAHINPAVSLGFAVRRVMSVKLLCWYWAAQFLGAFGAAALTRVLFGSLLLLGASHVGSRFTYIQATITEIILTFLVMLVIFGCAEEQAIIGKQGAVAIGLTIAACGFFAGPISGASMNPARSIAPQILGGAIDQTWIYVAGPFAGAAAAAFAARLLFGEPDSGERKAAQGG
jgi:aquaporin Z